MHIFCMKLTIWLCTVLPTCGAATRQYETTGFCHISSPLPWGSHPEMGWNKRQTDIMNISNYSLIQSSKNILWSGLNFWLVASFPVLKSDINLYLFWRYVKNLTASLTILNWPVQAMGVALCWSVTVIHLNLKTFLSKAEVTSWFT